VSRLFLWSARLLVVIWCVASPLTSLAAETPPPRPADVAFTAFQQALKSGRLPQARATAQEFTARFPHDPRVPAVLLQKGLAEHQAGLTAEARLTWSWVAANYPKSDAAAAALEQLALACERMQQLPQKEELLKRLRQNFPNHAVTLRVCRREAEAKLTALDYAGAITWYQQIAGSLADKDRQRLKFAQTMLSAKGADLTGLLTMANELLTSDDVASAITLYEELLRRFPAGKGVAEAKTKLGWCYALRQDWDRAERLWRSVVESGPAQDRWAGESQWHIVQMLSGPRGKWEAAAALCDEIIKTFPVGSVRHEQAQFSKAWLFWANKKWAAAKAAFEDFLAAYPAKATHPPLVEYLEECTLKLANPKAAAP